MRERPEDFHRYPPLWMSVSLLAALILSVSLFVEFSTSPARRIFHLEKKEKKPHSPAEWLKGLAGLEEVRFAEYRNEKLYWEVKAPVGGARLQRFVFGALRSRPLLHLVAPELVIYYPLGAVLISARRVYYDPAATEWIFVQGYYSWRQERKQFARLHWFPDRNLLQTHAKESGHRIFRFWKPIY